MFAENESIERLQMAFYVDFQAIHFDLSVCVGWFCERSTTPMSEMTLCFASNIVKLPTQATKRQYRKYIY